MTLYMPSITVRQLEGCFLSRAYNNTSVLNRNFLQKLTLAGSVRLTYLVSLTGTYLV